VALSLCAAERCFACAAMMLPLPVSNGQANQLLRSVAHKLASAYRKVHGMWAWQPFAAGVKGCDCKATPNTGEHQAKEAHWRACLAAYRIAEGGTEQRQGALVIQKGTKERKGRGKSTHRAGQCEQHSA
jgi:hypothetical protein